MKGACTDCGKAETCKSLKELRKSELPLHYISCKNWKPASKQTIGDQIRSLSNEQLADLFESDLCKMCAHEQGNCIGNSCRDGYLEKLNQEVPNAGRR